MAFDRRFNGAPGAGRRQKERRAFDPFDDEVARGVKGRGVFVRRGGEHDGSTRLESAPELVEVHLYATGLRYEVVGDEKVAGHRPTLVSWSSDFEGRSVLKTRDESFASEEFNDLGLVTGQRELLGRPAEYEAHETVLAVGCAATYAVATADRYFNVSAHAALAFATYSRVGL